MSDQRVSKDGSLLRFEVYGDATQVMHIAWGLSCEDALRNYCKAKRLRVARMEQDKRGCWVLTSPQGEVLKFWVG